MFSINEIVYVNSLKRKAKVIGVEFNNQHVEYIIEDKQENEHRVDYSDMIYVAHGYGF